MRILRWDFAVWRCVVLPFRAPYDNRFIEKTTGVEAGV